MLSSLIKPYQDGTPELLPITMEGKNTFGCKINEEIWIPFAKIQVSGIKRYLLT